MEGARKALSAAGRPTTAALEEARTAAIRKAENIFKLTKLSVYGKKQTRKAAKVSEYLRAQKREDNRGQDKKKPDQMTRHIEFAPFSMS